MRILVTGCAGFIGSTLTEYLLNKGEFVLGIDNFNDFYDVKIKKNNIKKAQENNNFVLQQIDLLNVSPNLLKNYAIDCIIHLAAYPGVRPSFLHPEQYSRNNIDGTLRLLQCMRELQITKGVFASSSSVYGNNPTVPFSEDAHVEPISIYGATKLTLESYCRSYSYAYNLDITCLRFFTCYGPRQRPDLAIHKFTRLLKEKKPIPMFGDGATSRDYTYIDDIVHGVYLAATKVDGFNIINLGNSYPTKLSTMIHTLAEKLEVDPIIQQEKIPAGDVMHTWANITKAETLLGWKPATSFGDGLDKFLEWINQ